MGPISYDQFQKGMRAFEVCELLLLKRLGGVKIFEIPQIFVDV